MHTPRATCFRNLHTTHSPLLIANVWDAASARVCALAGAPAVATSSAAVCWSQGYSDGGFLPPERLVQAVAAIATGLTVPLSVDVEDGGPGSPQRVADLVQAVVDAGAVGINIEDGELLAQVLADRIAALRERASMAELFINARTDVFLRGLAPREERVKEVIKRATLYADAGADALFVPGLYDPTTIAEIVRGSVLPVNLMWVPGLPSLAHLSELGVRRLSMGPASALSAYSNLLQFTQAFLATASPPAHPLALDYDRMNPLFA